MSVFVVYLMIPVPEDYIAMTTWMTVSDDLERALTVLVQAWFKVKQENSQIFCCYLKWDLIFPF